MEVAGLAVGIASLAGLVSSCLEAYDRVHKFRKFGPAADQIRTRIENQRFLLKKWAERVGIEGDKLQPDHHADLDDPPTFYHVVRTLNSIQEPLASISDGMVPKSTSHQSPSPHKLDKAPPFGRRGGLTDSPKYSKRSRLGWALGDKERLIEKLEALELMVKTLDDLVPASPHHANPAYRPWRSGNAASSMTYAPFDGSAGSADELPEYVLLQYREEIKPWLNASISVSFYERLSSCRTQDTCQWILKNSEYLKWLRATDDSSSTSRTLWLHGPPGFGKSVLSAFLIDNFQSNHDGHVVHFFCSASEDMTRRPSSILRSCIAQATKIPDALWTAYFHKRNSHANTASEADLWKLLAAILRSGLRLTLVLDGFDECLEYESEADRRFQFGRADFLQKLHRTFDGTSGRLLVVSRDDYGIRSALGFGDGSSLSSASTALQYRIQESDVEQDVGRFASRSVSDRLARKTSAQQDEIALQLAQKSKGMFLWVKLQGSHLTPGKTAAQIRQDILSMPTGIDSVYDLDWSRIQALTPADRDRSVRLLRWITFATRPLTVFELFEISTLVDMPLEIRSGHSGIPRPSKANGDGAGSIEKVGGLALDSDNTEDIPDDESMKAELLSLCGTFAHWDQVADSPDASVDTISLTHFTARSFLLSKYRNDDCDQGRLSDGKDNTIAMLCLQYLNGSSCWTRPEDHLSRYSYPLRNYAVRNWPVHSEPLGADGEDLERLTQAFFSLKNSRWVQWRSEFERNPRHTLSSDVQKYFEKNDVLSSTLKSVKTGGIAYYASLFGLNRTLRSILASKAVDVNEEGGLYGSPLQAACAANHLPTTLLLLRSGADVNLAGGLYGSALNAAAYNGNAVSISVLLKHGASVNHVDISGRHALYFAARQSHVSVLRLLLEAGAPLNQPNNAGWTPLNAACVEGYEDVVEELLSAGSDISMSCNISGYDPLMTAAHIGHVRIIDRLTEAGARIDTVGSDGRTALHCSVLSGKLEAVKKILSLGVQNLEVTSAEGKTPLMEAAEGSSAQILIALIDAGADMLKRSPEGKTLLHFAAWRGNLESVETLLAKGSDAAATSERGITPLHSASGQGHEAVAALLVGQEGVSVAAQSYAGFTPLHFAAVAGHLGVVKLLCAAGADLYAQLEETSTMPLHLAVSYGHLDVATYLLDQGSPDARIFRSPDVSIFGRGGASALHLACRHGLLDMVKLLLARRTAKDDEASCKLNLPSLDLTTPIHYAAANQTTEVTRHLIAQGADVNLADRSGRTPLMAAASLGNVDLVRLLVESGADCSATNSLEMTALAMAVRAGRVEVVGYLLPKTPILANGSCPQGHPLRWAMCSEDPKGVELLTAAGYELSATNAMGLSALHINVDPSHIPFLDKHKDEVLAVGSRLDRSGCSMLHFVAGASKGKVLEWALDAGFEAELADSSGWTPLFWAAYGGSDVAIKILLERGADGSRRDWQDWTPGRVALYAGHAESARLLGSEPTEQTPGEVLRAICDFCGHGLIGTHWHCETCTLDFDLCFKCVRVKHRIHDAGHVFRDDFRY